MERPGLHTAFDLSRLAYMADFVLVPIEIVAVGILLAAYGYGVDYTISLALGLLAWSLTEYAIHRLVFHGRTPFEPMHQMHHALPKDMIGVASWATCAGFIAVGLVAWSIAGVPRAAGFTFGVMLGYLAYCAIHVRMHHGPRERFGRYLSFMHHHHVGHHRGGHGNFGVTSPLWDLVFRTYR